MRQSFFFKGRLNFLKFFEKIFYLLTKNIQQKNYNTTRLISLFEFYSNSKWNPIIVSPAIKSSSSLRGVSHFYKRPVLKKI